MPDFSSHFTMQMYENFILTPFVITEINLPRDQWYISGLIMNNVMSIRNHSDFQIGTPRTVYFKSANYNDIALPTY